ncbi:MAG TPA: flagellar hook-associated protein 3 [Sedimenticola sp.]|nr:flagellar hook-associated protein 3 [Sedimenticola sp.]
MTIRISTRMMTDRAVTAMLGQQRRLSDTEEQLSTGKRILTPADDPAGAARVLDYNRAIATVDQYQNNADRARSRLEQEESLLAGTENLLIRAKELAIQGNNDSNGPEDKRAIAGEIRQLLEQVLGIANTRDANGEYLFGGFQTGEPPFVRVAGGGIEYRGDNGARQLQISTDRRVADGDNGFDVFVDIGAAPGKRSLFATLDSLAATLAQGGAVDGHLEELDQALANVLAVHTTVGARINTIDEQVEVNADTRLTLQRHLSQEQDLDYTEAISRYNRQTIALDAAQKAYIKIKGLSLFDYL